MLGVLPDWTKVYTVLACTKQAFPEVPLRHNESDLLNWGGVRGTFQTDGIESSKGGLAARTNQYVWNMSWGE